MSFTFGVMIFATVTTTLIAAGFAGHGAGLHDFSRSPADARRGARIFKIAVFVALASLIALGALLFGWAVQ